jgi:hypothetical protein
MGVLKGVDPKDRRPRVFLVGMTERDKRVYFAKEGGRLADVMKNGRFLFRDVGHGHQAVCLYAGSRTTTSAASKPFIE